jgi:hypothetical protein
MYGLKAVPFKVLNEEIVFGFLVVAGILFAQDVDPRAKAVENAVHVTDGDRNAMLDRLDCGREVVEGALYHAIYSHSLNLGPIGDISY